MIMHMGTMATIGQQGPPNLKHIIINNGAHDSVGGQPTVADNHSAFSFGTIALGCGYREVSILGHMSIDALANMCNMPGPILL